MGCTLGLGMASGCEEGRQNQSMWVCILGATVKEKRQSQVHISVFYHEKVSMGTQLRPFCVTHSHCTDQLWTGESVPCPSDGLSQDTGRGSPSTT